MMDQDPNSLTGGWTHSFEEDESGVLVYRPTRSFAFPPSRRGRSTLVFAEGSLSELTQGPDDRLRDTGAQWRTLGTGRFGCGGTQDSPAQTIEVIERGPDILKIRRHSH
jgi:hypothetical protein